MIRVILADSKAMFLAGAANLLANGEGMRIVAQCGDVHRMYNAIVSFPGSVVIFAAFMGADLKRLNMLFEITGSRGIVIAEGHDPAKGYIDLGFHGVMFRDASGEEMLECVRHVAIGDICLPSQIPKLDSAHGDVVGWRVLDRLSPNGVRVLASVVHGCKNREIANSLNSTEQVVKNHLHALYRKTDTSNRLELVLFATRHPLLMKAIAEAKSDIQVGLDLWGAETPTSPATVKVTCDEQFAPQFHPQAIQRVA